ncbi:MAG: DUF2835 domain-containing protein, partial [Ectothiorhodospira sp.]
PLPGTAAMPRYHLHLEISREAFLQYYSGVAAAVVARSAEGPRVRFPASSLRPFVGHEGINGRFVLTVDEHNRLQSLDRAD